MSDKIQKQFETILREFAQYAGAQERTSIYPGAEVINATYTADRIIVRGRQGYYEPALIIPGSTFTNGDLVTVLYVQGAEPIALQQSPGSGTSSYPGHTVQDEAVSLPQRRYLNFTGAGVTASDDAVNNQTDVTIPGGGGAPVDAQYLTLALDATLTDERRFVPGDGLNPTDGGAGGDYDLEVDIHGLAALGAAPVAADEFMVYDDTAGALRKATWTNILSGIAGWPFTGKYLTVDTTDPDAEYATIAAAIAAAAAGDTIVLSSEQIGCVNQTLPDGVHMACFGPSAAILTNSTNAVTLNVGDGSVVFNIEVRNTYAAAAVYTIYMPTSTDTARFYNVTANPDNSAGVGNAYAFHVGGASELINCRGITDAKAYGYGFVGVGVGAKRIHGGYFDGTGISGGDDINNQAGSTVLVSPILANGNVDTLLGASGTAGPWQDTSGNVLNAGTTDMGSTTAAQKWGNVYQAVSKDTYALNNEVGLGKRMHHWLAWQEHFDYIAALPAGWAWAGAPFVTPAGVLTFTDSLVTMNHAAAARSFLYRVHDGSTDTAFYRAMLVTNSNSTTSYGGVRLDDGSDNNYVEAIIKISATNAYTIDVAYNLGGAGRTVVTGSTYYHPQSCISLFTSGTLWTNWNISSIVQGINTAGLWILRPATAVIAAGWTPTRQGIVMNWQGASWHEWYFDAWIGD